MPYCNDCCHNPAVWATVDVGMSLSHVNQATIDDLQEVNKLVRDMRRSADQTIKFHAFKDSWDKLWIVQWCDASDKLRPDGGKTGGLVTGHRNRQ